LIHVAGPPEALPLDPGSAIVHSSISVAVAQTAPRKTVLIQPQDPPLDAGWTYHMVQAPPGAQYTAPGRPILASADPAALEQGSVMVSRLTPTISQTYRGVVAVESPPLADPGSVRIGGQTPRFYGPGLAVTISEAAFVPHPGAVTVAGLGAKLAIPFPVPLVARQPEAAQDPGQAIVRGLTAIRYVTPSQALLAVESPAVQDPGAVIQPRVYVQTVAQAYPFVYRTPIAEAFYLPDPGQVFARSGIQLLVTVPPVGEVWLVADRPGVFVVQDRKGFFVSPDRPTTFGMGETDQ